MLGMVSVRQLENRTSRGGLLMRVMTVFLNQVPHISDECNRVLDQLRNILFVGWQRVQIHHNCFKTMQFLRIEKCMNYKQHSLSTQK